MTETNSEALINPGFFSLSLTDPGIILLLLIHSVCTVLVLK